MFASTLSTLLYVRSGKLKSLGLTGANRSSAAPDIPVISEIVPEFEFVLWQSLVAPAKKT
jgi:tripartite-type tricarboxylate transporter receptor subunit TctC